jgi:hypothetical protein
MKVEIDKWDSLKEGMLGCHKSFFEAIYLKGVLLNMVMMLAFLSLGCALGVSL